MDKAKTSNKHQKYLENLAKLNLDKIPGLRRSHPLKDLTDSKKISLAVFECLLNNDPEGAMEMIEIYLHSLNKSKMLKDKKMPKSTMYSAIRHRNPTIKTLAKIMNSFSN